MSISDKYRPQFTVEDYLQWKGRWELIDGMPYSLTGARNIIHQKTTGSLHSIFRQSIDKNCAGCEVVFLLNWKINNKSIVQPDLIVVCRKITTDYLEFTPSLIIEILSPSTAYKDRHEKFELYEQEGVQYYLLVDPQFNKIEIYQLIENKYQPVAITPSQFTFTLEKGCELPIDFTETWS